MAKLTLTKDFGAFVAKGQEIEDKNEKIRPEVKVSVIAAHVTSCDEKNGTLNCVFNVDGQEFKHNGYVWANTIVGRLIKEAFDKEYIICVRLEKKRKKNVDPRLPIVDISSSLEVAKKNIVKTTVGVFNYNTKKWLLTDDAQSSPSEDPEDLLGKILSLEVSTDEFFGQQGAQSNGNAQYVSANRNQDSAETVLLNLFYYLFGEEKRITNNQGTVINTATRQKYAKILLRACDYVQVTSLNLEKPIPGAYSHTRTRMLLFKFGENAYPLTKEILTDEPKFKEWVKKYMSTSIALCNWAAKECNYN